MARKAGADYKPLMTEAAVRRLLAGEPVTIAAIADEFEVSKPLVHFYFGNLEALLEAAWESLFMAFVDNDTADVAKFGDAVDWEGLNGLVAQVFSPERDDVHRAHVRASADAQAGGPLRRQLDASTKDTIAGWVELVEQYSELGVVSTPLDPEALALLIAAVPMGVTVMVPELTDVQRTNVATAWASMLRAVLDPDFDLHGRHQDDSEE